MKIKPDKTSFYKGTSGMPSVLFETRCHLCLLRKKNTSSLLPRGVKVRKLLKLRDVRIVKAPHYLIYLMYHTDDFFQEWRNLHPIHCIPWSWVFFHHGGLVNFYVYFGPSRGNRWSTVAIYSWFIDSSNQSILCRIGSSSITNEACRKSDSRN